MKPRHCVVLAGGLGSRLREVTSGGLPKVLVPVLGKPFLHYKLESLRDSGVTNVTLLVGELGYLVDEFIATDPVNGIVCTTLHDGPKLLGTAGAIGRALPQLPETFWVTYGDSYFHVDLQCAEDNAADHGADEVMVVFRNRDSIEPSNISLDGQFVKEYRKGSGPGQFEWIDYGIMLLTKESFSSVSTVDATDLSVILSHRINVGRMFAFEVSDRYWEIGTPDSLRATEVEFRRRFLG